MRNESFLETNGLFQVNVGTEEAKEFVNAMGVILKNNGFLSYEEMDAIGHNTKEFAQALAPKATGALIESINYKVTKNNSLEVFATAERLGYPYGASIEYGYHVRGGNTFVEPRPFMRPALQYATELTRHTLQEAVIDQIRNWHFGKGVYRAHNLEVGKRTVHGNPYRFSGKRETLQRGSKYLRSEYTRNQTRDNKGRVPRMQHNSTWKMIYGRAGHQKGGYKNTVWGGGDRGRRS